MNNLQIPQNNNINSSTNIIKSVFLNEDNEDFGEPMSFDQIDNLPIINNLFYALMIE